MSKLTNEMKDVIDEYIAYLRNSTGIVTAGMVEKKLMYDFVHGKGESTELLNDNFYDIITTYKLEEHQIKKLAKEVSLRENKWITGSIHDFDFDEVVFDGHGYVIMSDGTRIDIEADLYKQERDAFNKVRTERLAKASTNGKEYI